MKLGSLFVAVALSCASSAFGADSISQFSFSSGPSIEVNAEDDLYIEGTSTTSDNRASIFSTQPDS